MLNYRCPVQTSSRAPQFNHSHNLLYHESSIGFLVTIDHFCLCKSCWSIWWWSPCNPGLHKQPHPYLSVKNAFASSIVSRSGNCTHKHCIDQMIFIPSVSFRHLLPWNTVHPQGLLRNEDPFFINMMNTEVKTWSNFVTAKSTHWTLCTSVSKGCKAIVVGMIITTSFGSLLILKTVDFGISNADAINLIVLLWLRGRNKTASQMSWQIHCWARLEFFSLVKILRS